MSWWRHYRSARSRPLIHDLSCIIKEESPFDVIVHSIDEENCKNHPPERPVECSGFTFGLQENVGWRTLRRHIPGRCPHLRYWGK